MKKIIVLMMCMVMILLMPVCASASDMDYSQTTNVSCDVQGSFMLCIPMDITAGGTFQISALEVNIPDSKAIAFGTEFANENGSIYLVHEKHPDVTLEMFVKDEYGNRFTGSNPTLGVFNSESEGYVYNFSTEVPSASSAKAGHYTGVMNFNVTVIDYNSGN